MDDFFDKTGKSIDQWLEIVEASTARKHKEIMDFLQKEEGVSYGFANIIAHKFNKSDAASFEDTVLVEIQYKGKENLRPVYELLMAEISTFGNDITITPKKDSVSLIRKRQFALIKPATKTRIDLGLKFKNKSVQGKLENSGPFGAMCTHRVQLFTSADIDAQLLAWIREAYEESV
jgi:predicted transport protein